jgi:hypothetical protein
VDASNSLQPTQDLSSEEEVVQDMASSSTQWRHSCLCAWL